MRWKLFEGTNSCIKRGGELGKGKNVKVIKVTKPNQDFRFDVPVVGPETILTCVDANISTIVVEAGCTLILGVDEVRELCGKHRVSLHAMSGSDEEGLVLVNHLLGLKSGEPVLLFLVGIDLQGDLHAFALRGGVEKAADGSGGVAVAADELRHIRLGDDEAEAEMIGIELGDPQLGLIRLLDKLKGYILKAAAQLFGDLSHAAVNLSDFPDCPAKERAAPSHRGDPC